MKKLYFAALLAASLCFSASAQDVIYVIGTGTGISWTPASPMVVQKADDGNYNFTIENLEKFQFSTTYATDDTQDDWMEFYAGEYTMDGTPVIGEPNTLYKVDPYGKDIVMGQKGDYEISVAGDFSTITFKEVPTDFTKISTIYVAGSYDGAGNGWNIKEAMAVEKVDGQYTFNLTNATVFRVSFKNAAEASDDGWGTFNAGSYYNEVPVYGDAVATQKGTVNMNVIYGSYEVTMPEDLSTVTVKPTADFSMYLVGDVAGWSNNENFKFEATDHLTYWLDITADKQLSANSGFKFSDTAHGWNPNYGTSEPIDAGKSYSVYPTDSEIKMEAPYTGTIKVKIADKNHAEATFFNEIVEHKDSQTGSIQPAIAEENGPAEYFNLQGVRVANPTQGLYILRQNGKARKVFVK